MDIRRLRQFTSVAQLGSFGRASTVLNLTQPSLTRNIRSLEEELGVQLFERGPRGAALTGAGRKFLPRAQSILNEVERAVAELDPGREAESEQVRLGLSPNFLFEAGPQAIVAALREAAHLNVQVSTGTFEALVDQLRAREADLALCLTPDFSGVRGSDTLELTFEVLAHEQLAAVAPAGHPALAGEVSLDRLAGMRWIVPYQLSLLYRFESAFHRRGFAVPIQGLNTSSISLAKRIAEEAGMLCVLPASLLRDELADGRFVMLDLAELRFEYVVALMTRQRDRSPASQRMAEALRRAVAAWRV